MGLFKFGARCCNNCIHWKCSSKREVRGNPPKEIYATSNCDKCSLTDRNTLSKNCCDGFAHLYGATVTFPYQEEQCSSGGIASALLDSVSEPSRNFTQSVVDYLRESESVQEETQEKPSVRQILIKNGMDPSASKSEQQNFETIYRGMADGDSEAYYLMGQMLYSGQYGAVLDKRIAYRCFLAAAKKGCVKSEYSLGHCYYYGQGVDKDENRAFAWLKRASEHGDADAKKLLGKIQKDREIRVTREECERKNAARQHQIDKCVNDFGMDPDASEMAKTLFMATVGMAADNVQAQLDLAGWFEKGECGAKKDMLRSHVWYLIAANNGEATAAYKVGYAYEHGYCFEQDVKEAIKWYEKAAELGNVDAKFRLSMMLISGDGVDADACRGLRLLKEAAEGGCLEASSEYGMFCLNPDSLGEAKDNLEIDKGIKFLQDACAKNHGPSECALGYAYMRGLYVERDLGKAKALLRAGLEHGGLPEDVKKDIEETLAKLDELNG